MSMSNFFLLTFLGLLFVYLCTWIWIRHVLWTDFCTCSRFHFCLLWSQIKFFRIKKIPICSKFWIFEWKWLILLSIDADSADFQRLTNNQNAEMPAQNSQLSVPASKSADTSIWILNFQFWRRICKIVREFDWTSTHQR